MDEVKNAVNRLVKLHGTRNPFTIARFEGYTVMYKDWTEIKGYYFKALKRRFIAVNQNLDELSRRIVCAHELGHGEMHDISKIRFLKERTLFPAHTKAEREANLFSAEMILDDSFELDFYFEDGQMPDMEIFNKLVEIKMQATRR